MYQNQNPVIQDISSSDKGQTILFCAGRIQKVCDSTGSFRMNVKSSSLGQQCSGWGVTSENSYTSYFLTYIHTIHIIHTRIRCDKGQTTLFCAGRIQEVCDWAIKVSILIWCTWIHVDLPKYLIRFPILPEGNQNLPKTSPNGSHQRYQGAHEVLIMYIHPYKLYSCLEYWRQWTCGNS